MIGVREMVEIENDLLAGESSIATLAERYEVSARQMIRYRAALRKRRPGLRVLEATDGGPRTSDRKTFYGQTRLLP